jgi:hypothetical protein
MYVPKGVVCGLRVPLEPQGYRASLPESGSLPSVFCPALDKEVFHYRNHVLCRMSKAILHSAKTLPSVTLGKEYSANILSANGSLPSTFFGHTTKTLPSVEKHPAKKSTRQIKNRKNPKKQQNIFLNYRNNFRPLPILIPIVPSFSLLF